MYLKYHLHNKNNKIKKYKGYENSEFFCRKQC